MHLLLLLPFFFFGNEFNLTSTAFSHNGNIPQVYTCQGKNINPPLTIGEVPKGTISLTLIMDDPDGDKGIVDHWIVWNIPATTKSIAENSKPGVEGSNTSGKAEYKGPCPPTGSHHYHFMMYAIDRKLELKSGATKAEVLKAIEGHILGAGELIGMYEKTK